MSTDQNNKTTKQQDAAEFVTKSFFLAEVAANADPKIAEQNRQIAEQKMVFEAKKAKQAERERRRNRELSEKEKQANNEAALFITKSYSLTELAANADPKIAAQNRQIADQKKLFEAQALRAEEESKSPEQLVVDSWSKVKAIPNYQSVAGELLFRRIFELNANAAGLFQFAEDHSIDDDRMYKSVMFVKHSTAVISTVTAAIGLLEQGDMGMLFSVLIDLGARHAAFDLQKVHYDLVGESLMYTLEKALGESYTSKVKSGWVSVYGVITEKMMEGAKECEE
jgi:nitric oxide dioxygenase